MKIDDSDNFDPFLELRRRTARVCEHFPAMYWSDMRRSRSYPFAFLRSLTQFRLMALTVPTKSGGAGLGIGAACAVVEVAHKLGCDFSRIDLQYALCFALSRQVDAMERSRWMLDVASGHSRLQMCNIFEDGVSLAVQPTAAGFRLDGRAAWPERTEHCDLSLLIAHQAGCGRREMFVVNVNATPGVSLQAQWTDTTNGQVFLLAKNATVRSSELVPAADKVAGRAVAAKKLLRCASRIGDAQADYLVTVSSCYTRGSVDASAMNARKAIRAAAVALSGAARLLDDDVECSQQIASAEEASQRAARIVEQLSNVLHPGDSAKRRVSKKY